MSLTSKSRKESTESNAAQQMHNTMGLHPETSQLYDRDLRTELPSKRADSNDVESEDVQPMDDDTTDSPTASHRADAPSDAEIEESRRASWGQAPDPNAELGHS